MCLPSEFKTMEGVEEDYIDGHVLNAIPAPPTSDLARHETYV